MRPLRLLHESLSRLRAEDLLISMTVITDLASLETVSAVPSGAVFVLGHFDGVHAGHRALLAEAVRMAAARGSSSLPAVWTLTGLDKGGALTTEDEKLRLLRRFGAGWVAADDFSEIRSMTGEDFFRERILSRSPAGVICGYNFTFGRGASSGAEDLREPAEAGTGPASFLVARGAEPEHYFLMLPPIRAGRGHFSRTFPAAAGRNVCQRTQRGQQRHSGHGMHRKCRRTATQTLRGFVIFGMLFCPNPPTEAQLFVKPLFGE